MPAKTDHRSIAQLRTRLVRLKYEGVDRRQFEALLDEVEHVLGALELERDRLHLALDRKIRAQEEGERLLATLPLPTARAVVD